MNFFLLFPGSPSKLSAAESAELAARVAALAQSGLPLEGGLRALAEEAGSRRVAGALRALAARLELGEKFETAIAAPDARLPVALRGLIVAGVESGRLPEVLDLCVLSNRRRHELRRYILATFAYPAFLLLFVSVLLILCRAYVADEFLLIFRDSGTPLPEITEDYFRYSGAIGWSVLALALMTGVVPLLVATLPLGSAFGLLFSWIPLIGPVVSNDRYIQFTRLMAMLLEARVPLPDALRLTAISMRGTMLADRSLRVAGAVERGQPLDAALTQARFPESLACLVDWGQHRNALTEALRAAVDTFESRLDSQTALLSMTVLPLIYLLVVGYIGLTILALIMPMIPMVGPLSGGR